MIALDVVNRDILRLGREAAEASLRWALTGQSCGQASCSGVASSIRIHAIARRALDLFKRLN